jgi:hypothetical protein
MQAEVNRVHGYTHGRYSRLFAVSLHGKSLGKSTFTLLEKENTNPPEKCFVVGCVSGV